jgi:hypothetical protein
MTIGTVYTPTTISLTDTIELRPKVYQDDVLVPAADITGVQFTILKPDASQTATAGAITNDGEGFLLYADTDLVGLYPWTAQFTLDSGVRTTIRDEFRVSDPFDTSPVPRATEISEQVWMRLEDCFDSERGGPWLRDMTLAWFEPEKVELFVAEGLMFINQWPPLTNIDLSYFTTPVINPDPALPAGTTQPDPDRIIIVQATLLAVIRHLMRSYVEQENPVGANIVWQSRRDYLDRWRSIFEIENQAFKEMLALWKRQFLNYGQGALLVHSKAGRLYGPSIRARNAVRGYY